MRKTFCDKCREELTFMQVITIEVFRWGWAKSSLELCTECAKQLIDLAWANK